MKSSKFFLVVSSQSVIPKYFKTSYIVFSKGLVSSQTELFIQTVQIERVLETKFLGVIISHKLSWKSHIAGVCSKMAKNTGIIAKVRHLLPRSQVRLLYLTLVQPYMNYCCIVWAGISKTQCLDKIHKIQKRFCRLITFSDNRAHSAPLFKCLKYFQFIKCTFIRCLCICINTLTNCYRMYCITLN